MKLNFNSGLGALIKGLIFAAFGGAVTAAGTAVYNYKTYSDPVDWMGLKNAAAAGAILGAYAWYNGHKALWTTVPGTIPVPVDQHAEDLQKLAMLEDLQNPRLKVADAKSAEAGK